MIIWGGGRYGEGMSPSSGVELLPSSCWKDPTSVTEKSFQSSAYLRESFKLLGLCLTSHDLRWVSSQNCLGNQSHHSHSWILKTWAGSDIQDSGGEECKTPNRSHSQYPRESSIPLGFTTVSRIQAGTRVKDGPEFLFCFVWEEWMG